VASSCPRAKPRAARLSPVSNQAWLGDSAVRQAATPGASPASRLSTDSARLRSPLAIDLQNDWDLIPYFNFRSESEQAILNDAVYA
jgi:hypothetical protein